jgi:hypothetical protein
MPERVDNSFAALLELLDPHRFARGIKPTKEAVREITVRRLKQDLLSDDGTPRFPRRTVVMLEVEHPDMERAVHADLVPYGTARARRLGSDPSATVAADFVVTLLKKRLFSSPAAFLRTLEVHRGTITRNRGPMARPTPTVLQRLFDDVATALDDEAADDGVGEVAREAIEATAAAEGSRPTAGELKLLDGMITWGRRAAVTEDARTTRLLDWVQQNVKPGGRFLDERVIVFSEYRATQRYLQERLAARGSRRVGSRGTVSSCWTGRRAPRNASGSRASGRNRRATTGFGCSWRPMQLLRVSRCSATAICSRMPRSLGTRTAWSSATTVSTAMVSPPKRCSFITASARAGRPQAAARWRATWTSSRVL